MIAVAARSVRRFLGHAFVILLVLALLAFWRVATVALLDFTTTTAWILAALLAFLLTNALRAGPLNRIPFMSARLWYRFHVSVALVTGAVVIVHTDARLPQGLLEGAVTLLFAATFLLGLTGIVVTRAAPARLALFDHRVHAEEIPAKRRDLRRAAEAVVLRAAQATGSDAVASEYARSLQEWFDEPRDRIAHLLNSRRVRRELDRRIRAHQRRLDEPGRAAFEEIRALAGEKADLDERAAILAAHHAFLTVHLSLSVVLGIVVVLHAIISLTFAGAAP